MKIFYFLSVITIAAQTFETPLQECWHLETPVLRNSQIASDNEAVFLPLPEGIIKSVNLQTGKAIWKSELGGEIFGSLLISQSNLYALSLKQLQTEEANKNQLSVNSLSSSTGITQWKTDLEINSSTKAYIFDRADRIYIVTEHGKVYVLKKKTGSVLSKYSLNFRVAFSPIVKGGKVYVGEATGKVFEITLSDNDPVIFRELEVIKEMPTAVFLVNNDLYIGDKLGKVRKLNVNNKKVDWVVRTGGEITDIVEVNGYLLIASSDNFIYLISKTNGNRVWKKRLQGKNQGSSPVTDKIAVLVAFGEKSVVLVELKSGKTINQINLDPSDDNSFMGNAKIFGNAIILPTLQGFYAFAEKGCSNAGLVSKK